MRSLMLVGALVLMAMTALPAAAQQKPAPAPAAAVEGISASKVLAIGIGVILGVVAAEAVASGEGVTLVGGAVGGLLGAWWYDNGGSLSRAALRQPDGVPTLARAEQLALAH